MVGQEHQSWRNQATGYHRITGDLAEKHQGQGRAFFGYKYYRISHLDPISQNISFATLHFNCHIRDLDTDNNKFSENILLTVHSTIYDKCKMGKFSRDRAERDREEDEVEEQSNDQGSAQQSSSQQDSLQKDSSQQDSSQQDSVQQDSVQQDPIDDIVDAEKVPLTHKERMLQWNRKPRRLRQGKVGRAQSGKPRGPRIRPWTAEEDLEDGDFEEEDPVQFSSDYLYPEVDDYLYPGADDLFSEEECRTELTRMDLSPVIRQDDFGEAFPARSGVGCSYSSKVKGTPAKCKTEPRTNFPLPAEIRDRIYHYLLNAAAVEWTPERHVCRKSVSFCRDGTCSQPALFFQKQILRVNKTIGAEALHRFQKENKFVKLQFRDPDFLRQCAIFDVPILHTQVSPRFCGHMFTISVDREDDPSEQYLPVNAPRNRTPTKAARGKRVKGCSVLILGKYLPRVIPLLRHYCEREFPSGFLLNSEPGRLLTFRFNRARHVPKFRVQLCENDSTPTETDRRHRLIAMVHDVLRLPADVLTRGLVDGKPGTVKLFQAPQLVWEQAVHWDRLQTFSQLKRVADDHMRASRHEVAYLGYSTIISWMHTTFDKDLENRFGGHPNHSPALKRLGYLMSDIIVSKAHSLLCLGDGSKARKLLHFESFSPLVQAAERTSHMCDQYQHLHALAFVMRLPLRIGRYSVVPLNRLIRDLQRNIEELRGIYPQTKELRNDINVLRRLAENPMKADLEVLRKTLSFGKFPFQPYDSQGEANVPKRPEGVERFQDKKHRAMFSEQDKERLRNLPGLKQRKRAIEGEVMRLNGVKI
ncbi:hypothetical protein CKM354_000889700 [Cercospora kikuchii]|uniref:Uncharacterized protein n=1 Tax=Cercospora kikuchii TaxID=84275 RepID=A0A9P3CJT2_9PEZI|nr:uncharacterized protein CKM354_000889700 [Cercospora kikuchii]GIZ45744.1 hypothetical protein CKM354_000889700 [Cercospora kikuchii]